MQLNLKSYKLIQLTVLTTGSFTANNSVDMLHIFTVVLET